MTAGVGISLRSFTSFHWNFVFSLVLIRFSYCFHFGPSFFSYHFLSFSISFTKLTIFTILRLYMACKMWKDSISPLSPFIILYIIGLKRMKLQNWKKVLLRIQKKGHKNKHKKTWMKWNDTKWTIWYFQQCACINAIYFAPEVTTTYRMKNIKSSTRGLSLEMSVLARARAQLLNMLYISTHLSVPHAENI